MRHFTLLFILLTSTFFSTLHAQTQSNPNALAWRWIWNNYQYPISEKLNSADYTTGGELAYSRYLNRWFNVAVPLKFGQAALPVNDAGTTNGNEMIGSIDALLHIKFLPEESILQPYLMGGAGIMAQFENEKDIHPEFPVGIGLNIRLAKRLYASAETQYRINTGDNRDVLQHALGIKFDFGGANNDDEDEKTADTDNDGIPDTEDQCPNQAGSASLFGCPDSDGDGVSNKLDECPDIKGPAELKGCPDSDGDKIPNHLDDCPTIPGLASNKGCPSDDRDNDGIKDEDDRCPDKPGSEYTKGCPDLDMDGVADLDDLCPSESGLPEDKGCPDSDDDGIADPFDKCPETPGTAANKGCPELKAEEKEVLDFAMKAVQFETGSNRLLPESYVVLNQIADIMLNHPERKLRIGGHTDSIGTPEANQILSERRAKACRDYLVSKGVPASRMSYKGFGESRPIADNMFAPGREKNRRVEFEIYVE
ncbi:MAG TPA: OmpA family protein [Bacteroidetes bacterium]|nr:OmpA family protein [Bacteroidota bacterium]